MHRLADTVSLPAILGTLFSFSLAGVNSFCGALAGAATFGYVVYKWRVLYKQQQAKKPEPAEVGAE